MGVLVAGLAVAQRLAAVDRQPPDALFLPYLKGERCPFHDSKVRGAFLGLDRSHGSAELFYAVLEGVALALRANVDALGIGGGEIRMIGGGAVNSVWPQLIADVAARNVVVTQIPTAATAFGAFSIAAARLGVGLTFALAQLASDGTPVQLTLDIPKDHPAFPGHFPGQPLLPGALLVSEVLEAARSVPALAARLGRMPTLAAAKFLSPVRPGASLVIDLLPESGAQRGLKFEVRCESTVALSGRWLPTPASEAGTGVDAA